MNDTGTKPQKPEVKSFTVRLNTPEERAAFAARAADAGRSLDGHAGFLIRQDLIKSGYIKPNTPHNHTQS